MAKKGTTTPTSLVLAQALDEALCFGWINGQAKSRDAATVFQRYIPRTAKSTWSQINQGHVARLEDEGRMQTRGWAEVEKAKADGRWEAAYGAFSTIQPPDELMAEIEKVPGARATWEGLSKTNRFAFIFRLANVRTAAGRERNVKRTVEMLARGEVLHPRKKKKKEKMTNAVAQTRTGETPSPSPVRMSRAERAERRSRRLEG